jgi:hypothetical protein
MSAIRGVDEGRLRRQLRAAESKGQRKGGKINILDKKNQFCVLKIIVLKVINGNLMYVVV